MPPLTLPVIARSAATKQSILSLRGEMDCFAALAMTAGAMDCFAQPSSPAWLAMTPWVKQRVAVTRRNLSAVAQRATRNRQSNPVTAIVFVASSTLRLMRGFK